MMRRLAVFRTVFRGQGAIGSVTGFGKAHFLIAVADRALFRARAWKDCKGSTKPYTLVSAILRKAG